MSAASLGAGLIQGPLKDDNRARRERRERGERRVGGGAVGRGLKVHYWADLHLIAIYNQVIKPLEMGVKEWPG